MPSTVHVRQAAVRKMVTESEALRLAVRRGGSEPHEEQARELLAVPNRSTVADSVVRRPDSISVKTSTRCKFRLLIITQPNPSPPSRPNRDEQRHFGFAELRHYRVALTFASNRIFFIVHKYFVLL